MSTHPSARFAFGIQWSKITIMVNRRNCRLALSLHRPCLVVSNLIVRRRIDTISAKDHVTYDGQFALVLEAPGEMKFDTRLVCGVLILLWHRQCLRHMVASQRSPARAGTKLHTMLLVSQGISASTAAPAAVEAPAAATQTSRRPASATAVERR